MLKNNPYFVYITAGLFSSIASAMYTIFISWILYEISEDAFYSGFMVGIGFIPGILLNLFLGIFVDRYNRWKLVMLPLMGQTIVFSCILYFVITNNLSVTIIMGAHVIIQLMGSLIKPAIQAIISQIFEKEDYSKVIGTSTSLGELGWILGVSLTGVLLNTISDGSVVLIMVILNCISVISMYFLKFSYTPLISEENDKESVISDLKKGYKYLITNKIIIGLIGIGFVGQLILHSNLGLLPVYTKSVLFESSKVYGLLEIALSIGAIIAGFFASKLLSKFKLYVNSASIIILMISIIFIIAEPSVKYAFVGILLMGFGVTLLRVSTQSFQQMITDPRYLGRMASYRMTINQVSVAVGSPMLGFISKYYGTNFAYASFLIPLICSLILSVVFVNKVNSSVKEMI